MDKETRNAIERATQRARRVLEEDFAEQLEGTYDVIRDGRIGEKPGAHLDGRQKSLRNRIVAAIEHKRLMGMTPAEAVSDYLRDAAFTALNRFVALKMLEARDLVQECITRGDASAGFAEFCGLAPGVKFPDGSGYRLYIESIFDELSTEVKVLFDCRDPASALWPRRAAFEELLQILNADELKTVWADDETIGWVYQYFNSGEERRQMREASQTPRNSRELAVRNQFFTPRYVVQFLTDNTLGRIWYEMRNGKTSVAHLCEYMVRRPGEIFADEGEDMPPDTILEGLSHEELRRRPFRVPHRPKKDPRDIRILDPACGSGHFLLYCFVLLLTIYEEAWADEKSPASEVTGRTLREDFPKVEDLHRALPGLILRHNLHGVDIDPRCAQIAQFALWMRAQRAYRDLGIARAERPVIRRANIVIAEPMPGEKELLAEFLRWLKEDKLEALLRRALDIPPERSVKATKAMADSLADLVVTVWDAMKLAGEMGSLLRIEHDLARAVEKGRSEWKDRLPLFRVAEYGLDGTTTEKLVRVAPGRQQDFWTKAEMLVFQALADYTGAAGDMGTARRRLFADDAGQGFALVDLMIQRFDVLLTNPPFGEATPNSSSYLEIWYYETRLDLFSAFVARLLELVNPDGLIGVLTPRDGFFKKTLGGWRDLILKNHLAVVADLGMGVLDAATVRVAAYVIAQGARSAQTRFIDLVDISDRDTRLRTEVATPQRAYDIQLSLFSALPLSRFLYWLPSRLWEIFTKEDALENRACTPRYGLATFNDERFCRLSFEIAPSTIGTSRTWAFMSKGGDDFPYGGVSNSLVLWKDDAAEMAQVNRQANGQIAQTRRAVTYYFQPAVSFSNRSVQFCVRWHPANFAFSMRGPAVIPLKASQAYLLGFFNSRLIRALIEMQTASQTYTTGVLKELRWVEPDKNTKEAVESAATEAFELIRQRLVTVETDPFFEGLISSHSAKVPTTVNAFFSWRDAFVQELNDRLAVLQSIIDEKIAKLYGVSMADIARCQRVEESEESEDVFPPKFRFNVPDADALISYGMGVAFRRWQVHLASKAPQLRDPAPEMPLAASHSLEGIPVACDDPGRSWDIESMLRSALNVVLPESAHEDVEALEASLGTSLREWIARSFFAQHLSAYSGFGRRAPIYWQLSTPSVGYSVWLYVHAATRDTLFRVQDEYVAPKLTYGRRRLEQLRAEAGTNPTSGQRKSIEAQAAFIEELQVFLDEVKRVAPLWNPNLNDGIMINFAPLWRLVPQNRAWQRELRSTWEALVAGASDWSHLAMHLWPERVVPKCAADCSLAIAHGLEDVFWAEDEDGKRKARAEPLRPIDEIVNERTSPAVKDALKSLLEAPDISGGARRSRRRAA
jgi:hypothetical protein